MKVPAAGADASPKVELRPGPWADFLAARDRFFKVLKGPPGVRAHAGAARSPAPRRSE